MRRIGPRLVLPQLPLLALLALLVAACGGGGGGSPPAPPPPTGLVVGDIPPAFSLPDVNPGSPSFGSQVAPSGSLGFASAWYFGWAT